ncbi:helix-turn-helix domain-containing protein [Marinomonas fungiae]|uniref:Bacterial regulatory protein, Fis family n=1 Tax=Marinomonas fungiae TaxID=1137284 RepID=A0A0K6IIS6_9GAMM|nr:helix-turn-helix domain-containing protein [Marinomonas fungiae]CUB03003.1 Bacterial regulatory protein, Fis family [Marinomonas fungiae]
MKACLVGVSQEETQAVAPILHFLGIEVVLDPQQDELVDFFVVGSLVDVTKLSLPLPSIWLQTREGIETDSAIWCCPIPWRQDQIMPILNRLAESPNMPRAQGVNLNVYVRHLESLLIRHALTSSNGVVSQAANLLQIQRTTLIEKMRRYRIDKSEF